jgi:hypothetical protein
MRLFALICGVLGTTSFFLLRTRLPPKPPGRFFYFKAFKNPVYVCLVVAAAVSYAYCFRLDETTAHCPVMGFCIFHVDDIRGKLTDLRRVSDHAGNIRPSLAVG